MGAASAVSRHLIVLAIVCWCSGARAAVSVSPDPIDRGKFYLH